MRNNRYLVVIAAGYPHDYSPKVGWDTLWLTRADAEQCAERARQNDGWSARVVETAPEGGEDVE